ncbi:hypothetical protein E4U43_004089 [Claviceps pusilla]|uniref:Uncharacterized protein n=1 Tax=Claviceps pusilla TaxID=123648 RepID=A0A9P7SWC3_9HYPO|nr:hypothetical protein E4U43_004089 [Claviceps pusilla]
MPPPLWRRRDSYPLRREYTSDSAMKRAQKVMLSGLPYGYANAKEGLQSALVSGCLEMSGLDPNKVYSIHLPECRGEDSGGHWRASDGIGSGEYGYGHLKGVQIKRNDNRD